MAMSIYGTPFGMNIQHIAIGIIYDELVPASASLRDGVPLTLSYSDLSGVVP